MKQKDHQLELIHQLLALFPKDWNPQADIDEESPEFMMLKIGAELANLHKTQQEIKTLITNIGREGITPSDKSEK